MNWSKNFNFEENKGNILIFISFVIFLLLIYFLFYTPLISWYGKKDERITYLVKVEKERKILEAGQLRYKRLEEELSKEREKNIEKEERGKELAFKNIVELERYIDEVAKKNYIVIETIGRIERVSETDKIYIPYIFFGELESFLKFIQQLESGKRNITFGETPYEVIVSDVKTTFSCKISANVLEIIENETEEKTTFFREINGKGIKKLKLLNFNGKEYIIINYSDGTKDIFYNGEILELSGVKYKVIWRKGDIYLDKLR